LCAVRIGMAVLALFRSGAKIDVQEIRLQLRRTVTIGAGDGAVRSRQHELGRRMVKTRQVFPRRQRMARLASGRLAVLQTGHTLSELPAMRIAMACRTRPVLEAKLRRAFERFANSRLVTIGAGDGDVSARERETRVLMLRQREFRRTEPLHRVTALATVRIRRRRELSEMYISMAVGALAELDLEERRFARGHVTLCARHFRMLAGQRIAGG